MDLHPGEIICDKCNGEGQIENVHPNDYMSVQYYECKKCHGTGKLDWIENIVGKKNPNPIMSGVTWLPPSDVEPKNAQVGQAYIDSSTQECYIFDGTVWVHAVSQTTPL